MAENYGVLFVLNRASQYLSSTKAMADNEKDAFKNQLYSYLNGQSVTTVDSKVLAFLMANDFLTEDDLIKLNEKSKNSQSQNAKAVQADSETEPEA